MYSKKKKRADDKPNTFFSAVNLKRDTEALTLGNL